MPTKNVNFIALHLLYWADQHNRQVFNTTCISSYNWVDQFRNSSVLHGVFLPITCPLGYVDSLWRCKKELHTTVYGFHKFNIPPHQNYSSAKVHGLSSCVYKDHNCLVDIDLQKKSVLSSLAHISSCDIYFKYRMEDFTAEGLLLSTHFFCNIYRVLLQLAPRYRRKYHKAHSMTAWTRVTSSNSPQLPQDLNISTDTNTTKLTSIKALQHSLVTRRIEHFQLHKYHK